MASKPLPSPNVIRQLLRYNPETGELFWKERPESFFPNHPQTAHHNANAWNAKFAGKLTGTARSKGYRHITLLGFRMKAHRVAWCLYHGAWPTGQIDHINGSRGDNRIVNLRDVAGPDNQKNMKVRVDNTSGNIGVYFSRGRWKAYINVNGNRVHLGSHKEKSAAVQARKQAERSFGFHKNHGRSGSIPASRSASASLSPPI